MPTPIIQDQEAEARKVSRFFAQPTQWQPRISALILKPTVEPEQTEGGIILPETVRRKSSSGYINVMGAAVANSNEFQIGDEVFFEAHSEFHVMLDDINEEAFILDVAQVILRKPAVPEPTDIGQSQLNLN